MCVGVFTELSFYSMVIQLLMHDFNFKSVINREKFDQMIEAYFPEILALKDLNEKNICHDETVYEHTFQVFENTRNLLNPLNNSSANEKILFFLALYHDIGKLRCLKVNPDGSTSSAGHEIMSSFILPETVRSTFDAETYAFLVQLIISHAELQILLDDREHFQRSADVYRMNDPEKFKHLVLFNIADIENSHLKISKPEEYAFRMCALRKLL